MRFAKKDFQYSQLLYVNGYNKFYLSNNYGDVDEFTNIVSN
jgi:hypothetical protein